MLEKDREARRNDSGLTQSKFVDILFALNPKLRIYIKGRRSRIQSVHC